MRHKNIHLGKINCDLNHAKEIRFDKVLKKLRQNRNLSQQKLANGSGLTTSFISLMERNLRKPGLDTLYALADGLNMEASEILKELEEHPDNSWLKNQPVERPIPKMKKIIYELLIALSFLLPTIINSDL